MGDYLYIKTEECYSKRSHCLFYGELNMFKLSDRVRVVFALLGVSSILISMYLIPFIKTENKFWEILLFILGVLLIGIALLNPPKNEILEIELVRRTG